MSEQANSGTHEVSGDEEQQSSPALEAVLHEHVRTDGETGVDDALGAADDPT